MKRPGWLLVAVVLVLQLLVSGASAQSDGSQGATPEPVRGGLGAAVGWLLEQQDDSGAFVGFSGEPDAGTTVDAVFALIAAEHAGVTTGDSIPRAMGYLESGDVALVYTQTGPGQAAKLSLLLSTLGLDPHDIAKVDPLAILEAGPLESGFYGFGPFDHAYALLALNASGSVISQDAIDVLASSQAPNGGWGFEGTPDDAAADSNTTAMVIMALAASGMPDAGMIQRGLDYLALTLREDGAAYNVDAASLADSNSSALVAQAVLASGGNPSDAEWGDLISDAIAFQNEDGSFGNQAEVSDPNLFSTVQVIPALSGFALPLPALEMGDATPVPVGVTGWLRAA